MIINYNKALDIFKNYVKLQKEGLIIDRVCDEDIQKRIQGMDKKVIHSLEVVQDGTKVVKELGFNDSVTEFSKIAFLNHDIGRFPQIRYTGNFTDSELSKTDLGVKDHGELGKVELAKGIIEQQIPKTRIFDAPIQNIVNDHVNKVGTKDELSILSESILKNEDIYNIFKNGDEQTKRKIVSAITQIVQDVDRLDIFHQILDDRWTPMKTDQDIDPRVFEMFYKGEYLNMASLKEQNLWNPNVGELVRLGFVNQIKLLSVAKVILEQNVILKLKDKRQNPKVKDAFDYTNDLLKEMIAKSEDGITVERPKGR